MECSNAEKNEETGEVMCKATGYCCRHVSPIPWKKSTCIFDEKFLKCAQMKQMLEMIRSVQVGSTVVIPYRRNYGWYTKEVIDSSLGTVLKISKYGLMEIDVHAWKGTWKYGIEDFTRTIFLSGRELEKKLEAAQDELDEQERIRAERREDGRESEE